jgi:arginine repressor
MSLKPLTDQQIRAILAKQKIPTKGEIVRDLLRNPAPIPAAPPQGRPNGST